MFNPSKLKAHFWTQLFLLSSATTVLTSCGDGASQSASTTTKDSTTHLAGTITQLCPNCLAKQATSPSKLEADVKAINPRAISKPSSSPSQLQMTIESLKAAQAK